VAEEEPVKETFVARSILVVLGAAVAAMAFACGGDDEPDYRNEAALAAASFWEQEAAAGVLPEGTVVESRGTRPGGVISLSPQDGFDQRVCVEYQYIRAEPPFETHVRVYVVSLTENDTWQVEVVAPDGTCEGVA
jgi:hypothetical protein